jgi:hypothetical protein
MKKKIAAIVAVLALSVSACGTGETVEDKGGYLDGSYTKGTIQVDGQDLTCITMKRGAGDASWGGLWCFPPTAAPAPTPTPDEFG